MTRTLSFRERARSLHDRMKQSCPAPVKEQQEEPPLEVVFEDEQNGAFVVEDQFMPFHVKTTISLG